MPILLKRLTAVDAALLANIGPDVFDEPVQPDRLARYLAAPGHLMVLAFDGDLVVGQCTGVVHHHPDKVSELYVDEVGTASSHLRQGIASTLLEALFAWGRELGCEEAWLGTELDNTAANGLYRKFNGAEDTMKYYEFDLR
ncbi:aminoglycoside adenylyltransferase [Devosia limi DSM 17137]|uniref:Aminoglycoside 6'-N-acetyltransferase I n=1 Tax=Devosia limi DSM 17137 TaxID=1121477 RepID=A0A0F5LSJ7_9HYPH|nr:GNAT family N-acetyltransferase [Devosia limi]KKB85318.1 aminoglycoside adenylyltransferase [Devosia limi DSM 17137]SHF16117.1 aminoglycoside 6'-N-acetyltransferase I [Devosia limi DSM 17137]